MRCKGSQSSSASLCSEVPWKNIFEQPFCYTSEKDLEEWKALVGEWPPECQGPCDACGKNACLVDEIICPACKGKGSK